MTAPKPKTNWTTEEVDAFLNAAAKRAQERLVDAERVYMDAERDLEHIQKENDARFDAALDRAERALDNYLDENNKLRHQIPQEADTSMANVLEFILETAVPQLQSLFSDNL